MVAGYTGRGGKPDPDWWLEAVNQGAEFRDRCASESSWNAWRSYYRGDWADGILPVNLFFTLMRTIVPRIYFRNPSISIQPAKPGLESMLFARVLQRVDNKLIRQMRMKDAIKRIIQDTFMFGTGIGKLGFGAQYTPTPDFGVTGEPLRKDGQRVEYRDHIFTNMPWFTRLRTSDFVVPSDTVEFEEARWQAAWIRRSVDDVRADPRLENTRDLNPSSFRSDKPHNRRPLKPGSRIESDVDLVEIRDKKLNKVMVIAPHGSGQSKVLFFGDDKFLIDGAVSMYPLVFNADDERAWGVPDSKILEPYQLEINEIRTQAMKHRRLSIVKILSKRGVISEAEIEKMLSEEVSAVIDIDGEPMTDVRDFKIGEIPSDLFAAGEVVMQDVRETVGFSRNQFGEKAGGPNARVSATESNIINSASEIRVDERRDMVADMLVDVVEGVHSVIFNQWDEDQVVDIIGPGGIPLWVKFQPEMLKQGQYEVKVDPDSGVPETKDLREQKAMGVYEILKSNPMIDPEKLTQFLLSEMKGVQFDDLMRAMPMQPEGPAPGNVIDMQEFKKTLGGSLGQRAA